jgi:hypothetical protein
MKSILGRSIVAAVGAAFCLLATGLPAGAASVTSSPPAVTHFSASVTSLPASGGSVRLSATVKQGSECVFTSSPRLPGLPATVSCASGSASRTVRLPANAAAGKKTYKFGLTVSGHGGKAAAKPLTVVVREAAPAVTQVAVKPSDLPSAGGATALSALVSRSATCTVSATPAVAGLPVTRPCAAGSTPVRVLVPVTLPALSGTAAKKYSLTLKVSGPGGTSTVSASSSVWPAMKFSAPVTVDAPAGWLGAVSCTSSSFCMGLDLASGSAFRWNGASWSAPDRIETGPYLDDGYDMHLSCVSAAFCLAVDTNGNSFTYNGTKWSPAANIGLDAATVSCATPTFCMAAAAGQSAIFSGSAWSAPVTISNTDQIEALSCPSDSFCMAVSAVGLAYTYSTSGWSASADAASPIPLVQVSCASTTFCVAVSSTGRAYFYNGSWAGPAILNASGSMDDVTCPIGTTFCLALGSNGSYYTTHGGATWTGATTLDAGNASVGSCASATSCMVTFGTRIFVLGGTSWKQSAAPAGPLHGFTYSVSCPTRSYCVAVDWSGAYLVYNGKTWSSPQTIGSQASAVDSVSCSSPDFCMAVDASNANGLGGHVFIFNGHSWQYKGQDGLPLSSVSCIGPDLCKMLTYSSDGSVLTATWNGTSILNGGLDSYAGFATAPGQGHISCASATFCAAVDQAGNEFTFNGSSWSKPTVLDPGVSADLIGVSCPTAAFCVAIDAGGHEYTFSGKTWTGPAAVDSAGTPQAISCTISHFCLMVDLSGNVATFNGAVWSATSDVDPGATAGTGLTGASCADAADCVAVDWEGNALTGTG